MFQHGFARVSHSAPENIENNSANIFAESESNIGLFKNVFWGQKNWGYELNEEKKNLDDNFEL